MKLGLDISTTRTGWAIIDEGELLEYGVINTSVRDKYPETIDICSKIEETISDLNLKYNIEQVNIEEPLNGFRRGGSSASTIIALTRINAMVCYCCFKIFGKKPNMFNSSRARKNSGILIPPKTPRVELKKIVCDHISKKYGLKFELTKKGNLKPGTDDIADAIVLAEQDEHVRRENNTAKNPKKSSRRLPKSRK